jgi:hypothetical protein
VFLETRDGFGSSLNWFPGPEAMSFLVAVTSSAVSFYFVPIVSVPMSLA